MSDRQLQSQVLYEEAFVAVMEGKLDASVLLLKKALGLDPNNTAASALLWKIEGEDFPKDHPSIQLYKKALDAFLMDDLETSERLATESIELWPENAEALRLLNRLKTRK